MPITELRVRGYRAFEDTGALVIGTTCTIVGRNDVGKSGLLHALKLFFDPPKKGLAETDCYGRRVETPASVEVAFAPERLSSTAVKIDAKNTTDVVDDRLVDAKGLLRLRVVVSTQRVEKTEMLVSDIDAGDLFPLGLMDHDKLLQGLEAVGLPAVKAGKQTNQEKRAELRNHFAGKGALVKEAWVDASEHEKALRAIMPEFVLFADDANYGLDETGVQNQFRGVVEKALSTHSATAGISTAIKATIQGEFDKVQERLARLTDTITGVKAEASVNWKKAVEGIGLEWTDRTGVSLPFACRGAGVRRLFMVAYFQYQAAESMHDPKGQRYVFAIEEPEVHLHPGAQASLNEAFEELAALGHCIALTTHSPVFASCAPAESLVLVSRGAQASTCDQVPSLDLSMVAAELGVEASHRLVGKNHVVLVEGKDDVGILSAFLEKLHAAGNTRLGPNDVLFLQCGGIGNLAFSANSRCMTDAGLKWAVVMDSDRSARGAAPNKTVLRLGASPPAGCLLVHALDRTYIENYLDQGAVSTASGINCTIHEYGRGTDPAGALLSKPQWEQVKRSGPAAALLMTVADINRCAARADTACEVTWLFEELASRFGL